MSQKKSNKAAFYDSYLSAEEIANLLKTGKVFHGLFRVNATKRVNAYVSLPGLTCDILIDGEKFKNRAIEGDYVYFELLPESDWLENANCDEVDLKFAQPDVESTELKVSNLWCPNEELINSLGKPKDLMEEVVSKEVNQINELIRNSGKQPKGKVVGIFNSSHKRVLIGEIQHNADLARGDRLPDTEQRVYFHPKDNRYPNLIVQRTQLPEGYVKDPSTYNGHIFLCEITAEWPIHSKFPYGENLRSIGQSGSIQVETDALAYEYNLPSSIFPAEVVDSLKNFLGDENSSWSIPENEVSKRLDLRSKCIFTIDPSTAKDLDDALHIDKINDDTYEIGVHIADVSYFVKEGSPVDKEASVRATSIYLVQKVIPMLPPILCEELCSLNPNVDRLAFSCIWKMKSDGTLCENEKPLITRSIIRSCAKMDYATAQRVMDGTIPFDENNFQDDESIFGALTDSELWEKHRRPVGHNAWTVMRSIKWMDMIASGRRKLRMSNGALVLHKTKLSFRLDQDGNPISVGSYVIRDSNHLVEEYMLLANYLVAQELLIRVGNFAFLRNHPSPNLRSLNVLNNMADYLGVVMDTSTSGSMQKSLQDLTTSGSPDVLRVITALLMKPMQLATYCVAGNMDSSQWRHFALAIPYYTHFTSPIRRYADIMVHRLLDHLPSTIPGMEKINTQSYLTSVADHCNEMKKVSRYAQERSDEIYFAVYLLKHVIETDAIVIGIGNKSFTVLTNSMYGIQERLFVDDMVGVRSSFNAEAKTLELVNEVNSELYSFTTMTVSLMSKVKVRLCAGDTSPISITVSFIGAYIDN